MPLDAESSLSSSAGSVEEPEIRDASAISADGIIDPKGLGVFRLTMVAVTTCVGAGIFSLSGDLAAGGANTAAVLTSWAICFAGVLSLMMCFHGLSQARPELTGGIFSYAAAGFGDYVGFSSAWGYWISSCLTNASYALMLFGALSYFFPVFGEGNNFIAVACASAFLWFLTFLISRGVKEATGVNVIITLSKLVPLGMFVVLVLLAGKFDPAIFMDNFWGEPSGPGFFEQVGGTMIALVWVFVGVEGAVVLSGRARRVRDVGRATVSGFVLVFVLYVAISVLSLGIMPRAEMAELATPSLAGIFERAIGPAGAVIVNLGVVLSLCGAMLGYLILSSEVPYEAACKGVFPRAFERRNAHDAPIVTALISACITQAFFILAAFANGTYQFFYNCSVNAILIPYVCSTAYYMIMAWRGEHLDGPFAPKRWVARLFGTLGFIYTLLLVYVSGIHGVMVMAVAIAPGVLVYVAGQRERGRAVLPSAFEKAFAAALVVVAVAALVLHVTGISPIV